MRAKLVEAFLLMAGIVASVTAYVDTGKAWVSLCIVTVTLVADEGLERLRRTNEGK